MVKVIMGKRGSGKTKQLIEMVNDAIVKEDGHVVCIELKQKLRYDINYKARLVEAEDYPFSGYGELLAFVAGIYASNFDITHIFIDSLYKIAGSEDSAEAADFLDKLALFAEKNGIKFTVTISADIESATDGIKKYF